VISYCTETDYVTEKYEMVDDCSGTATTTVSQQFGECLETGASIWAIVTNGEATEEATEENANHVKTTFVVALAALAGAYI
jgi:hypothetical protein